MPALHPKAGGGTVAYYFVILCFEGGDWSQVAGNKGKILLVVAYSGCFEALSEL